MFMKDKVLKKLLLHWHQKYQICPEGETPTSQRKRRATGQGFLEACQILDESLSTRIRHTPLTLPEFDITWHQNKLPKSFDEFFLDYGEWQFDPSTFKFENNICHLKLPKFLYDYLFCLLKDIDVSKKQSIRMDWTPELEDGYGYTINYDTPHGIFVLKKGM